MTKKRTIIIAAITLALVLIGIGLIFPSFWPWVTSLLKSIWAWLKLIPDFVSRLVHSRVFWGIVCLGLAAGVYTVFYKGGNND